VTRSQAAARDSRHANRRSRNVLALAPERVRRRVAPPAPCCHGRSAAPPGGAACAGIYDTFTWMDFGFASAFFGRVTTRTPLFDSALIFSASIVPGSENDLVNAP